MKTILVSGASGIVGYGVLKSLSASSDIVKIGTSIYDNSPAEIFSDIFIKAPPTGSSDYINWLIETIKEYNVDMIVPGIEADMHSWADNYYLFDNVHVLVNNLKLINLCKDKWNFYQEVSKRNFDFLIDTYLVGDVNEAIDKFGFPLFAKPRVGFGSKGVFPIGHYSDLDLVDNRFIIQPLIVGGREYTVSAFGDGIGGHFGAFTMKRTLSEGGFTKFAEVVNISKINKHVDDLCGLFKPIGPTNFQFIRDGEKYKLLEINPRISSSTSIRAKFGYNESLMSICYFLYDCVPSLRTKAGKAIRYVEDHIIYED